MKLDRSPTSRLQELVRDGLISETKHPTENLWIYNYSPLAVYKSAWNEITLQCRGLILAEDGTYVARCFPKFFNVEEHSSSDVRWSKPFQVFEKMDGSLGIMYQVPSTGEWAIATRGSFTSDQARWANGFFQATKKFRNHAWAPAEGYTYLFEIVYAANRIVVPYDWEGLVFLAAIHIETGANVFEFGDEHDWPNRVKHYDPQGMKIHELKELELENQEGFVIFFPHNSTRMKTKFSEYVRLHRIITRTNTKRIWEALMNGDPIEQIIEDTPDEFYGWVKGVIGRLRTEFYTIEQEALDKYKKIVPVVDGNYVNDRKAFAGKAAGHRLSGILFKMYDGKDYDEIIWKMIKPLRAEGFVTVSDEEA